METFRLSYCFFHLLNHESMKDKIGLISANLNLECRHTDQYFANAIMILRTCQFSNLTLCRSLNEDKTTEIDK